MSAFCQAGFGSQPLTYSVRIRPATRRVAAVDAAFTDPAQISGATRLPFLVRPAAGRHPEHEVAAVLERRGWIIAHRSRAV